MVGAETVLRLRPLRGSFLSGIISGLQNAERAAGRDRYSRVMNYIPGKLPLQAAVARGRPVQPRTDRSQGQRIRCLSRSIAPYFIMRYRKVVIVEPPHRSRLRTENEDKSLLVTLLAPPSLSEPPPQPIGSAVLSTITTLAWIKSLRSIMNIPHQLSKPRIKILFFAY